MLTSNKEELLVGLISDTHIPSRGPEIPKNVIKAILEKNVDYLFHLGDFTTIDIYNELLDVFGKDKVLAVLGNIDNKELAAILPLTREIEIYDKKIFITHGSGGPNNIVHHLNKNYDLTKYDVVIFGHTHRPLNETIDGKLYLNPGSPTDKRFTDVNSYGFLKISETKLQPEIVII